MQSPSQADVSSHLSTFFVNLLWQRLNIVHSCSLSSSSVALHGVEFLGPFSGQYGCCNLSDHVTLQWVTHSHTFKELLAGILLEECFMYNWTMKIVKHELKDRLNLLLSVPRVVCQSCVLIAQSVGIILGEGKQHTHGPRSRIRRERYMAAAAT